LPLVKPQKKNNSLLFSEISSGSESRNRKKPGSLKLLETAQQRFVSNRWTWGWKWANSQHARLRLLRPLQMRLVICSSNLIWNYRNWVWAHLYTTNQMVRENRGCQGRLPQIEGKVLFRIWGVAPWPWGRDCLRNMPTESCWFTATTNRLKSKVC
jgi:hypothetical protein